MFVMTPSLACRASARSTAAPLQCANAAAAAASRPSSTLPAHPAPPSVSFSAQWARHGPSVAQDGLWPVSAVREPDGDDTALAAARAGYCRRADRWDCGPGLRIALGSPPATRGPPGTRSRVLPPPVALPCAAGAVRTSCSWSILKLIHMQDQCMDACMGRLFTSRPTRSPVETCSFNDAVNGFSWH